MVTINLILYTIEYNYWDPVYHIILGLHCEIEWFLIIQEDGTCVVKAEGTKLSLRNVDSFDYHLDEITKGIFMTL